MLRHPKASEVVCALLYESFGFVRVAPSPLKEHSDRFRMQIEVLHLVTCENVYRGFALQLETLAGRTKVSIDYTANVELLVRLGGELLHVLKSPKHLIAAPSL